jgi:hypothetical protein
MLLQTGTLQMTRCVPYRNCDSQATLLSCYFVLSEWHYDIYPGSDAGHSQLGKATAHEIMGTASGLYTCNSRLSYADVTDLTSKRQADVTSKMLEMYELQ